MLNKHLLKIEKENTFSKATRLINEYKDNNPNANIISLGIGDVSKPIVKPIIEAMKKAVEDLGSMDSFQGYGAYYGLKELRETILENEYQNYDLTIDEIFVGDGTKSDSTNILEVFDTNAKILVSNPIYPIYQNGAYALGRDIYFGDSDENYKMLIPKEKYDVIYLCSPSNPVGNALTRDELKAWIHYALDNNSVLIIDNVYRAFIESDEVPFSVYEIEGSKKTCIEMRSFSKACSFTGMRCSYFVIPKEINKDILNLWKERTINRFNGASYVSQKGAIASYKKESKELILKNIEAYKENTKYLKDSFNKLGYKVIGGIDSPYLWIETKNKMTGWETFDLFLKKLNIIIIPGEIFGSRGKYCFRVSGLGNIENSKEAIKRIEKYEKEI